MIEEIESRVYQIMYRCPFPGYWEMLAGCYVQEGERLLFATGYWNQTHYYEHARQIGDYWSNIYLYDLRDATAMCDALKVQHPHMEFYLLRYLDGVR